MILMPLVATALTSTAANNPSTAACVSARLGRFSRWYAAKAPLQDGEIHVLMAIVLRVPTRQLAK